MTIKALKPRLAEAGKIKIGGLSATPKIAKKSGREYYPPIKYDEFHVTTLERDGPNFRDDATLMWHLRYYNAPAAIRARAEKLNSEEKREIFGGVKVRKIPVMFHSDNLDDVLQHDYVLYEGKKLVKKCDGVTCEKFEVLDGRRTGRSRDMECECPKGAMSGLVSKRWWDGKHPASRDQICKPYGELSCLINLPDAVGPGALYKFRTTSYDSLMSLLASLQTIRQLCGGVLTNVPCHLQMHAGNGRDENDRETKFWAVHLEMDADLIKALSNLRLVATMRREILSFQDERPEPAAIGGPTQAPPQKEEEQVAEEFFSPDDATDADFSVREEPSHTEADANTLKHLRTAIVFLWNEYAQTVSDRAEAYADLCRRAGFDSKIRIETETNLAKLLKLQVVLEDELGPAKSERTLALHVPRSPGPASVNQEPEETSVVDGNPLHCDGCGEVTDDLHTDAEGEMLCQDCWEAVASTPDDAPDLQPESGAEQSTEDLDLLGKRRKATALWARYSQQDGAKPFSEIKHQLGMEVAQGLEHETNEASLALFIQGIERLLE